MNMTVKDLKAALKGLPDDMDVIVTTHDPHDANYIFGFKHIRTAGILSNEYEPEHALCLAPTEHGIDICTLLRDNGRGDTKCEKVLF